MLNPPVHLLKPIAFRKAKIVYNFGLSECNRVIVFTMYMYKNNIDTYKANSSTIFLTYILQKQEVLTAIRRWNVRNISFKHFRFS